MEDLRIGKRGEIIKVHLHHKAFCWCTFGAGGAGGGGGGGGGGAGDGGDAPVDSKKNQ